MSNFVCKKGLSWLLKDLSYIMFFNIFILTSCAAQQDTQSYKEPSSTVATVTMRTNTATAIIQTEMQENTASPVTPSVASSLPVTDVNSQAGRWLKGVPCQPPCFEGVIPGQTTASQALTLLQKTQYASNVKIGETSMGRDFGTLEWDWEGKAKYYTSSDKEISKNVIFSIYSGIPATFRLGDVIAAYGSPSHVLAATALTQNPKYPVQYSLYIIYLKKGFSLTTPLYISNINKPTINSETLLRSPFFFAPTTEGIRAAWSMSPNAFTNVWQGYKDFDFYCKIQQESCS